MPDQQVDDLATRLERERQDADRLYNDALTALDHAQPGPPKLPAPPRPFDTSRLEDIKALAGVRPTSVPGRSLRDRVRAFLNRLIQPTLARQQRFNEVLADHLTANHAAQQELPQAVSALVDALRTEFDALVRFQWLLMQYLQTVTGYVDTKDRKLDTRSFQERVGLIEHRVQALKREVEQTGSTTTRPATGGDVFTGRVDSSTYVGFEERFRGARDEIRGRVEDYVPILASASDVLDVGCGRGELLDALTAKGVRVTGIDTNHAMVDLCRGRGLDVEHADALAYLDKTRDAALGGLVAIQVVEHFQPAYLARFLESAYHKLRPGAPLILETINPACWMAFFETYIRDLTHQRPLHPDTLRYLVEASGFSQVDVQFRQPVSANDRLDRVALSLATDPGPHAAQMLELANALNAHADKLNQRLFSSMDYVVIARR